ncbi:hypothetical protein H8D36_06600 [archaeon]|nr:hypothetical protein [archaeon]
MALKGDRQENITDISFFMDATGDRGGVVCYKTVGSGAALDQAEAEVEYKATATGTNRPVGLLLNDVVNKDLTQTHLNYYKNEVQQGSKVTILRDGWVVTNMLAGTGITPAVGELAYVAQSGMLSNSAAGGVNIQVGEWMSSKDEDGYAKVYVKLPM